jgi:Ras-related protein M-Ras
MNKFLYFKEQNLCIFFFVCRKSYPMILVANKVDLVNLRKVSEEEGRELAAELQIPYIETSAKVPPVNVDIAFHELVRVIRQQNQNHNPIKKKTKKRRYLNRCRLM